MNISIINFEKQNLSNYVLLLFDMLTSSGFAFIYLDIFHGFTENDW